MISITKQMAREVVRTWCQEEDMALSDADDPSSVFRFHTVFPGTNKTLSLYQSKNCDDRIFIASGIDFIDYCDRFKGNPDKRLAFTYDLGMVLQARAPMFQLEEKDGVPRYLTLSDFLFIDELSKGALLRALRDVFKSHSLAVLLLVQYLGYRDREGEGNVSKQNRTQQT